MARKAVPYLTVGFGTRPQRLRTPAGAKPYRPPTPQQRLRAMSRVAVANQSNGVAVTTTTLPVGNAPAGRPPSNLGNYLIKPTPETDTGFEMVNDKPDLVNQVHEKYLKAFQLPPALQPKYLRKPEVMESQRSKSISRGWRKPRSRQG
jgi:hypothetical protein